MLTIRLTRKGKKNQPFFKVVVIDKKRSAKGGRAVEILGYVDPLTKRRSLEKERILYWLSKGAKTSATMNNLLIKEKIIEGKKIHVSKISKKRQAEINASKTAESKVPITEEKPAETSAESVKEESPAQSGKESPVETPVPVAQEKPTETETPDIKKETPDKTAVPVAKKEQKEKQEEESPKNVKKEISVAESDSSLADVKASSEKPKTEPDKTAKDKSSDMNPSVEEKLIEAPKEEPKPKKTEEPQK